MPVKTTRKHSSESDPSSALGISTSKAEISKPVHESQSNRTAGLEGGSLLHTEHAQLIQLRCEWIEPFHQNSLLNFKILVDDLLARERTRDRDIIRQRYGINGNEGASFSSIGKDHGLSRERVRQIIYRYISALGNTIYGTRRSVEMNETARLSLVDFLGRLSSEQFVHFDSYTEAFCLPYENILPKKSLIPYLVLAIDLLPHANVAIDGRNFVLFKGMTQANFLQFWKHLRKNLKTIVVPLGLEDAVQMLSDETPDIPLVTTETVRSILITLLDRGMYLERNEDLKVRTQFAELTTIGLQAERVLFEAGHPLHYDDIRNEILRRLKSAGWENLPQPDFNTGLFGLNPNVESKEKSGFWRLMYWKNF